MNDITAFFAFLKYCLGYKENMSRVIAGMNWHELYSFPDFDYASPILDFSIFRGQNRHFCPRLVSFEHQTKA